MAPDRNWMGVPGLAGGVLIFVAEALVVAGLVAVAWLIAVVIVALI